MDKFQAFGKTFTYVNHIHDRGTLEGIPAHELFALQVIHFFFCGSDTAVFQGADWYS